MLSRHLRQSQEDLSQTRLSFWEYLKDRVSGLKVIPPLAELIRQAALSRHGSPAVNEHLPVSSHLLFRLGFFCINRWME